MWRIYLRGRRWFFLAQGLGCDYPLLQFPHALHDIVALQSYLPRSLPVSHKSPKRVSVSRGVERYLLSNAGRPTAPTFALPAGVCERPILVLAAPTRGRGWPCWPPSEGELRREPRRGPDADPLSPF